MPRDRPSEESPANDGSEDALAQAQPLVTRYLSVQQPHAV